MAALRIARTVTGATKVALFAGSFTARSMRLLVRGHNVGRDLRTNPIAPGIPPQNLGNIMGWSTAHMNPSKSSRPTSRIGSGAGRARTGSASSVAAGRISQRSSGD